MGVYLSTSFCFACAALFISNLLAFLSSTASSMSQSFRAWSLDDAASPSALKSICCTHRTRADTGGGT